MSYNILLLQAEAYCLDCIWWWLFSLGAFLLGLLLNWWLFTRKKDEVINTLTRERDDYHTRYVDVEKDFSSLKYQYDESQKDNTGLRTSLQRCEADKAVLATKLDRATRATDDSTVGTGIIGGTGDRDPEDEGDMYAGLFTDDNLQIVEGIGPKIEGLLKDGGVGTWSALAAAAHDRLREILDGAGPRYRIHDPTSWPHQAKLAAAGDWEKLIQYQKFTDAGRETTGDFETDSKFEKLASKALGFSTNPEDLKVVEGIGPKIEGLLKADGINTWSELATASVERIQKVLDAAGDRYRLADPATWPQQAKMAAKGNWSALRAYQDRLQGGRK
jgi:predicted flap endonuclease-1-like 5' DNA nuclease